MYEMLCSPGRIGSLTLPNRTVMTAASCSLSGAGGIMTEDMMAYYERRAHGGVGLIVTEMVCVDERQGRLFAHELTATRDDCIPEFQKLADRVHPYGTKIFAQLFHPGSNGDPALNPDGLISVEEAQGKKHGTARAATEADLDALAENFGRAALRVKQGGFDGVEVHAAHHYLIHSFLSPVTNHRSDAFGGTLTRRAELLRRIIVAIRRHCGPNFPLMVRVSVEEYIGKEGYHADVGVKICQLLEQWGVDAIDVTASGTNSKLSQSMEPITYQQGWRRHLMRAVKRAVSIPVCGVSIIRDPAYAEHLLKEGFTDFIGSVRAFLADPDWYQKAKTGRSAEIVRCISCMSCLQMHNTIGRISCALCPETGMEAQLPALPQDGARRRVLVLGAGPAGLEAAHRAATRGFAVTLYEKDDAVGGQLRLAAVIPRKEKMQWLMDSLLRRCAQSGVTLRLSCRPTIEELIAQQPYAILDATGSVPWLPDDMPGLPGSRIVCTAADILNGRRIPQGESIVVVGAGMTGLELAELLSARERDNAVVVMDESDRIAPQALGSNRNVVTAMLELNNVVFMLSRRLTGVGDDRIFLRDVHDGEDYTYPCDRVILALGNVPQRPYPDALTNICKHYIPLGDASEPSNIWHAIHDAANAVRTL